MIEAELLPLCRDQGVGVIVYSRPEQLGESLGAVEVTLDEAELAACDEVWYRLPRERDPLVTSR